MAENTLGSRVGPPRKPRKQTQTLKSHRYEPFTKRVAKLKIDPIHKVQRSRVKESSDDISQSHFRAALDEWSELNLTTTFTSFLNRVNSLCENLPQLLYHADTIVKLLLEHFERQDPLALEALLSLVAHLAHDLGQDFEKYFAQTVTIVAKVSTTQEDPAVVEACFTCLAWMYKYLSRLLVQDLRPLLNILLPYFSARKDYIRRFTAESLAFLFRKAAIQYQKHEKPLKSAVTHLLQHENTDSKRWDEGAYLESCITLLTESSIGTDAGLHSSAPDLFQCLYGIVISNDVEQSRGIHVVEALLISLIHKTDAAGFQPLLDATIACIEKDEPSHIHHQLRSRLLLVVVATRSGSRIDSWTSIISLLLANPGHQEARMQGPNSIKTAAAILQFCPLDQLLPFIPKLINTITESNEPAQFFAFCETVARLGKNRFQDLLLPHLQKYIISRWNKNTPALVVTLNDLQNLSCIDRSFGKPGYLAINDAWESSIDLSLRGDKASQDASQHLYGLLMLTRSIHFPKSTSTSDALADVLKRQLVTALKTRDDHTSLQTRVSLGWGFQTMLQVDMTRSVVEELQYVSILEQAEDRLQILPFVEALSELTSYFPKLLDTSTAVEVLGIRLAKNLLNTSTELRRASVKLLQALYAPRSLSWLHQSCDLVIEILNTEYSISNARQLGMLIRRLPVLQKNTPSNEPLSVLLPFSILGLLPHYHEQLRKELLAALSSMLVGGSVEEAITDVVREWLQAPSVPATTSQVNSDIEPATSASAFECTKLNSIDAAYDLSSGRFEDPQKVIEAQVESAHSIVSARTPIGSRTLALQILIEIPEIAEKRSKIVVPAFLAAQRGRTGHDLSFLDESQSVNTLSPDIEEIGWSLRERKLFLQLISSLNNPRVLYRAEDIRNALFDLLSNGDAETRKLSLLALFKWKDQVLLANRDALLAVAEDDKTTSELAAMLNANDETDGSDAPARAGLLPVLLRLLFGQLIGRVGVAGSQEAKRKSLLRLIFRLKETEIVQFLDIVKGRLRDITTAETQGMDKRLTLSDIISSDQQYGFLRMCLSMLEILQTQFGPFGSTIIDAVLYCTSRASHQIHAVSDDETAPALLRNTRRAGIQCLSLIFEYCPELDLRPYISLLFSELIEPRLSKFVTENAQGVSGLLKIFSTWAKNRNYASYLSHENATMLKACWGLLGFQSAKADVKIFILNEIIGPLLDLAEEIIAPCDEAKILLHGQMPEVLANISGLLQQNLSKDLLFSTTKIMQRLAGDASTSDAREKIVSLLVQILQEPTQRLPPHVKAQVLRAIEKLAETSDGLSSGVLGESFFILLSSYFDFFRDLPNRETCCRILITLAKGDDSLNVIAEICQNLNASSKTSLDEMDYDKQAVAFASIHKMLETEKPGKSFLPVLHSLIYLTRTNEDAATRGNSLSCLKHFITDLTDGEEDTKQLQKVLTQAIRKQITNDSETVRADFVEMLGAVVKRWESEIPLQDMHGLLVGDDEEASFFINILHIQQHRRNRAMRRLTSQVEAGAISAENIAEYFLPLLQKFANDDSSSESALSTKGQSVASIMVLLQWLDWKSFRKVFRQYKQSLDQKHEDGKLDVRLLDHAADALSAAMAASTSMDDPDIPIPHLAKSLPSQDIIAEELKTNFIRKLAELSHYKDEGEISQRIPAAVVAVKLIKLLDKQEIPLLASPVVLDVAQILRSRTQETRDLARNKLAEIVVQLGSFSVQFVLKELRTALTRGYQLHVLSYTMHTILLATADTRQVGDLDYCIDDVVKVIFDDIFGVVGQEKDNQDYISSMKEVKRNKSYDSMEILAKCTSVKHLAQLVLPFESLLAGSLTTKQIRSVDELFRRIGVGISHSPAANSQELLVFAFELIQSFYRAKPVQPARIRTNDEKNRERFLIQKDNTSKVGRVTSSSLLFKIAKFAIDIARSTFARHSDLMTPENVHGFIPVIGDALVEGQEDVKVSALRLLSTVIKLRLPEFDENAKLYIIEAVKIVKSAVSTNEEAAQAALKLVAAVLREKKDVEVRESDVAYLLKRTLPDLEEPDRQGVTFGFVKAVMARKMQMPEVYELVDQIGLMMVTSHSKSSRDAARGVYVHFLLDYPQGKTRWAKQIKFLVKNLEYQHPEGRQSVMEAINGLHSKLDKNVAQETAAVVFIPLVLRMANDENLQCRELAGALLFNLFQKTSSDQIELMLEPVRGWLEQDENMMLKKLSLQTWSIFFNAREIDAESFVPEIRKQVNVILKETSDDDDNWEVKYQALELMAIIVAKYPKLMLSSKQRELWTLAISILSSNQPWLQQSAAALVTLLFKDFLEAGSTTAPLTSTYGLKIAEDEVIQLLRASVRILRHQTTSNELARITIQNLLFLGQCVVSSEISISLKTQAEDSGAESDDDEGEETNISEDEKTPNDSNHPQSIPALQYLLDQASSTLRREPPKQTSAALTPKLSFTTLITTLIQTLTQDKDKDTTTTIFSKPSITASLTKLFIPLLHLTSPTTTTPRSIDPLFTPTYTTLTEQCQILLDTVQSKVGNKEYMKCVTAATKVAREKRQDRRNKRAFDVIAEPERAARDKRRKFEKKKERRREVKGIHRGNRRKDLGF